MENKKNRPDLKLVETAVDVESPKGGGGSGGGGSSLEMRNRFGPSREYEIINGCLHQHKGEKIMKRLNAFARIIEQINLDDGLAIVPHYRIFGTAENGAALPEILVKVSEFESTPWYSLHWAGRVIESVGGCARQHVNVATKYLSIIDGEIPVRTVYRPLGWHKIEDCYYFITATGGIGETGLNSTIECDPGGERMQLYAMPEPLAEDELRAALLSVMKFFDTVTPANCRIGLLSLILPFRAVLNFALRNNFGVVFEAKTGTGKSELAAIIASFFGKFDGNTPVSNWGDSYLDMTIKSFTLNGLVHIIDDFVIEGSASAAEKLTQKFISFVRDAGNQAAIGRRKTDHNSMQTAWPRSLTITTTEGLPNLPASVFARLLIVSIPPDSINFDAITEGQRLVADGVFAGVMAAFIKSIAPRIDELKAQTIEDAAIWRNKARSGDSANSHARAADIFGGLMVAADLFADFAADAIGSEFESGQFLIDFEREMATTFRHQYEPQADADPVRKFFDLLLAAMRSGAAHLADSINKGPPKEKPHVFGWTRQAALIPEAQDSHSPNGSLVGFQHFESGKSEVWLLPTQAYREVVQFAKSSGEPFITPKKLLAKIFIERGLVETVIEKNRANPRADINRKLASGKVWVFNSNIFDVHVEDEKFKENQDDE
ncbi:hypothetical protein [Methylotuvimicrobium sp. KM1]|uniref:hypothetical protein n=1 Tax=Methylotuvimicrobium sp. KM1 TaxID=3377707 RepID=UPI00384C3831